MSRTSSICMFTRTIRSRSLPKIPDLVAAAKEDGQWALALTDNGNLYGAIEFYKEASKG